MRTYSIFRFFLFNSTRKDLGSNKNAGLVRRGLTWHLKWASILINKITATKCIFPYVMNTTINLTRKLCKKKFLLNLDLILTNMIVTGKMWKDVFSFWAFLTKYALFKLLTRNHIHANFGQFKKLVTPIGVFVKFRIILRRFYSYLKIDFVQFFYEYYLSRLFRKIKKRFAKSRVRNTK